MKNESQTFGAFLRNERLKCDMTQSTLAKKLGVSQNFVTYMETGQRKPTNEMIKKLSQILSVSTDKLYFLANPEITDIVKFDKIDGTIKRKISPALEELAKDAELRQRNNISEEDIEQLASMRLRGEVRNKEDYLFLLLSIRQVLR